MSEEDDSKKELEKIKKQLKKKKPRLAVPEEFLDNAKSYEDKQTLVKILTEQEKQRVVLIVKNMLKDAIAARDKK